MNRLFDSMNVAKAVTETMPVVRWMMFWVGVSALVWAMVGLRMLLSGVF